MYTKPANFAPYDVAPLFCATSRQCQTASSFFPFFSFERMGWPHGKCEAANSPWALSYIYIYNLSDKTYYIFLLYYYVIQLWSNLIYPSLYCIITIIEGEIDNWCCKFLVWQWMRMSAYWQECKRCHWIITLQWSKKLDQLLMPSLVSMVMKCLHFLNNWIWVLMKINVNNVRDGCRYGWNMENCRY